jgi:hypothetical protein
VPDPELDELKERARKLGQNVDWEKDPKYKRRPRATVTASAYAPAEESFGEKLRRTVKERAARNPNSRTAHEEQVEREHKRYRRSARKPTKGE